MRGFAGRPLNCSVCLALGLLSGASSDGNYEERILNFVNQLDVDS